MDLDEFFNSSEFSITINGTKEDPRNSVLEGKYNEPKNLLDGQPMLPSNVQASHNPITVNNQISSSGTSFLPSGVQNPLGWDASSNPTDVTSHAKVFNTRTENSSSILNQQISETPKQQASLSATEVHLSSVDRLAQNFENPCSPSSNSNSLETDEGHGESVDSDEGLAQSCSSNDVENENNNLLDMSTDKNKGSSVNLNETTNALTKKRNNSKSSKSRTGEKNSQAATNKKKRKLSQIELLEYNPSPIIRKTKRKSIPEEQKDAKYWERRQKNNMAAKRSRDMRREKECCIKERVIELETENNKLKDKVEELKKKLALSEQKLKQKESKSFR